MYTLIIQSAAHRFCLKKGGNGGDGDDGTNSVCVWNW